MLLYGFKDLKNCPQVTWITVILEWREQIKTELSELSELI